MYESTSVTSVIIFTHLTANWYKTTYDYNCDNIQMCNAIFSDELAIKTVTLRSKYVNCDVLYVVNCVVVYCFA
jgi:hypothetical protein